MRLPGLAWLDLRVETDAQGRTVFRQVAYFHPRGLLGQLYWWAVTPFHGVVFGGMQRNVARAAEEYERRAGSAGAVAGGGAGADRDEGAELTAPGRRPARNAR
jgi:hypothetical protein